MQSSTSSGVEHTNREIYTVSALNRETKTVLAEHFLSVWVEGEISNLACPSSGHIYFTLKDAKAQVRCAMFRMSRRKLGFKPSQGSQVLVKAQVGLYEARGDYQLIVEHMEESGDGALRRAFEALKSRLSTEGLFDTSLKKPIPKIPKQLGVITSASGAAIRDILTVLKRRFPAIPVLIYPVAVQGIDAKFEIEKALNIADDRNECDVLILARGGGSLEDLWAFNEEPVARAIHRCNTPIVTGIGHEIDFTIADFVADYRAATPSAAAESVSPNQQEWLDQFTRLESQLGHQFNNQLLQRGHLLQSLEKRLQRSHPGHQLQGRAQRIDELEIRVLRNVQSKILKCQANIATSTAKLQQHSPKQRLQLLVAQLSNLEQRMARSIEQNLQKSRQKLGNLGRALDTVSPLATLSRGYAIVTQQSSGDILRSFDQSKVGDVVEARLNQGRLICEVADVVKD